MRILVDHLTRMAPGYICVAGLDDEGHHIRPVIPGQRLPVSLLSKHGGPFALGATVELGATRAVGAIPQVEDHLFDPERCEQVTPPDPGRLWEGLSANAELRLLDIFGDDIRKEGPGAVVPVGAGRCSLGTLDPGYRPRIQIVNGKLRCKLADSEFELDLSVTDLRFYTETETAWDIDEKSVQVVQRALEAGRPVLLSVGLGRPWPRSNPMHWLQVNGIHLQPG